MARASAMPPSRLPGFGCAAAIASPASVELMEGRWERCLVRRQMELAIFEPRRLKWCRLLSVRAFFFISYFVLSGLSISPGNKIQ
jgi:hypothetical protein